MALWLATLQMILDRGQQDDWFNATWIRWASVVSVVSMIFFIVWELRVPHPLVDLRVLGNRNFAVGTLLITIVGVMLYSTTALLPLFLQGLMGYPALNSGMAMSPRGMGAIVCAAGRGPAGGQDRYAAVDRHRFRAAGLRPWQFGGINLEIATEQRDLAERDFRAWPWASSSCR